MICTLSHGLCLMMAFILLFFRSRNDLKRKMALKHPTIARNTQQNRNIISKFSKSPIIPANSLEMKPSQNIPSIPSIPLPSLDNSYDEDDDSNTTSKENSIINLAINQKAGETIQEEIKDETEERKVENVLPQNETKTKPQQNEIKYDIP